MTVGISVVDLDVEVGLSEPTVLVEKERRRERERERGCLPASWIQCQEMPRNMHRNGEPYAYILYSRDSVSSDT